MGVKGNQNAYPIFNSAGEAFQNQDTNELGLTKREVMAMHAMQAMLSNQGMFDVFGAGAAIASEAVNVADALLEELNK